MNTINQENIDSLEQLTALSRFYGANSDYVIAGGGNTSFKNKNTLWIKGSGVSLAEITPSGFVAIDREKLAALWKLADGTSETERETAVLAGMMAARYPGEENKRPSVETMLHDLLPFKYVIHTHPSLVNGITCSQDAEKAVRKLFGDDTVWIPISDPGFTLACTVREAISKKIPSFFFLQNHGVFVGADTPEEIKSLYEKIMGTIIAQIKRQPDLGEANFSYSGTEITLLQKLSNGFVCFMRNNEIAAFVKSRTAFGPVASAFTPDHIVYSGSDPLFIEKEDDIEKAWKSHVEKTGRLPKIVAIQDIGVFGIGQSEKAAGLALDLFNDTIKIAVYSESFGGGRFMTAEKITFINNWEAEQYRANQVK